MSVLSAALGLALIAPGTTLPPLKGRYLTGREARLPEDAKGKVALLAFGFSYESRHAVDAWVKRFRQDFAKQAGVTTYEIPMIAGAARLARWFIDSGMRRGTPSELHENVITVYGGVEPWRKLLGVQAADDAYLVLVDTQGAVRWQHSGPYNDQQYPGLRKAAAGLVAH